MHDISKALRRAYSLGQTYWQQADSESYKQNKLSDGTRQTFEALVDETISALASEARAAPSGQQAETDETWRRRAEHLDREMKAARVDVDSEIVEGQLKDFLLRFGGKYDGNGMWDVSLYLEDICQIMSALAASQAERPAVMEDGNAQ